MDEMCVYPYSIAEAKRNNEINLFMKSHKKNTLCAKAIQMAINSNYDGMHLNADTAKSVIVEYGYDRVNFVLANTVQEFFHDGRFSKDNKDWAKKMYIPKSTVNSIDYSLGFVVNSHPAVLDGFVKQARTEYENLKLFDFSHCEDKTGADLEDKLLVLNPSLLKDEY